MSIILSTAILLTITLLFPSSAEQVQTESSVSLQNDIRYHLAADKITLLPLSLGNNDMQIPLIRYPARQAMVKGLAILIGDVQALGQVDANLYALAKALPEWGWHTILITPLPEYLQLAMTMAPATVPEEIDEKSSTINSTNNPELENVLQDAIPQVGLQASSWQTSVDASTFEEHARFTTVLLDALNAKFGQQLGYTVLYAKGQSAAVLVDYLQKDNDTKIDALVLNNAHWPNLEQNQALGQQVANLPMPVLDLVSLSDNKWAKMTAPERANAAKIGLKPLYRQRDIIGSELSVNQQSYVAKEVVAWTYFLGW